MKKGLWVIERILCAFLLVSISMTSFSHPVNANEYIDVYEEEYSEDYADEFMDEESDISLEASGNDDEGGEDEDKEIKYYTFSFDKTILSLNLEESVGIEYKNGNYYVSSVDEAFTARFKF